MESEQDDSKLEKDREELFHLMWSTPNVINLTTFPLKYHIIRARPLTRKHPVETNKKPTLDSPTDILTENWS